MSARDIAADATRRVLEAAFDPSLHPRDRLGRFWRVRVRNDREPMPHLNTTHVFTSKQQALREAKRYSQNPNTGVVVIEPSGERWSL